MDRQRPISEVMQRDVVTLGLTESLDLAQDIMHLGRVRHMPVLEDDRLVGIVSNRDLLEASLSKALDFGASERRSFLRSIEVSDVMTRNVVTIAPETTLEQAARTLVDRQIGCLPVVGPDGTLLGLVTETDLVRATLLDEVGETEVSAQRQTQKQGESDVSEESRFSKWIQSETEDLKRMRDELRVQAHLGKAEMRESWETLEHSLESLQKHARRIARAAEGPMEELESDTRKLAEDLREGYRRIRDAI